MPPCRCCGKDGHYGKLRRRDGAGWRKNQMDTGGIGSLTAGRMHCEMPEPSDPPVRILVVDDDKSVAEILRDLLSTSGRTVDVCYDGLEALERIDANPYDLIIVDLVMPRVGGIEVLSYARKARPDTIVIIVTGYASLETAVAAIKEGAYDYINKPYRLEEMTIAVDNALDRIRLIRENRDLVKRLQDAYRDLMELKKEKGATDRDRKVSSVNFFSSNLPGLHYLYNNPVSTGFVDKLQSLSSMKADGMLTENEFNEFKRHLLKRIHMEG